jgi:hypothetical protein
VGRQVVLGQSTYDLIDAPASVASLFTTHTVHLKGYDEPEDVRALDVADLPGLLAALRA